MVVLEPRERIEAERVDGQPVILLEFEAGDTVTAGAQGKISQG